MQQNLNPIPPGFFPEFLGLGEGGGGGVGGELSSIDAIVMKLWG